MICLPSICHRSSSSGSMPISAQQWCVSVGLFNCSRMRWLLKGGGAKMTAAPLSSRPNAHAVKRGVLPLLYLLMLPVQCFPDSSSFRVGTWSSTLDQSRQINMKGCIKCAVQLMWHPSYVSSMLLLWKFTWFIVVCYYP